MKRHPSRKGVGPVPRATKVVFSSLVKEWPSTPSSLDYKKILFFQVYWITDVFYLCKDQIYHLFNEHKKMIFSYVRDRRVYEIMLTLSDWGSNGSKFASLLTYSSKITACTPIHSVSHQIDLFCKKSRCMLFVVEFLFLVPNKRFWTILIYISLLWHSLTTILIYRLSFL